jgi:hypothetical protein
MHNFISVVMMYKICFFSLMSLLLLVGCGKQAVAPDTNEVVGIETPKDCPFSCLVGSSWKIGGQNGECMEISRFTSPALGISFLYASSLISTYD